MPALSSWGFAGIGPGEMIIALALASSLAVASPAPWHRKARHRTFGPLPSARAGRLTRDALLALRAEMLHDFLVRTGTEKPAFYDAHIVVVAGKLRIGPSAVTIDFLGAPIVRARVRNASSAEQAGVLLRVRVHDVHGRETEASTWIDVLGPGESRTVEIFCLQPLTPKSVDWTADTL